MTSRSVTMLGCCVALMLASASPAADFIRGDANEDGVVTFADSHRTLRFLFFGLDPDICGDAADFDNDGVFDLTDVIKNLHYQVLLGAPPASPFPDPGPDTPGDDPQIDGAWPCTGYGGGLPLEDAAARIRVLDVVVAGGQSREATILLAVSNSGRIAGYFAELDAGGIIVSTQLSEEAVKHAIYDLTGTLTAGFAAAVSDPSTGRLRLGFLSTLIGEVWIPPGEDEMVLEVHVCLEPGTLAGVYSLQLTAGELVDYETSRRIDVELVGGTLTVVNDLPTDDCVIDASRADSKSQLDIVFELGETSGVPGSLVEVPFLISTTDHAVSRGLTFSIDFDETALELVSVSTVLPRQDGEPWGREQYQFNNDDNQVGNNPDEGFTVGRYLYSYYDEDPNNGFPTTGEFTALALGFRILPDAPLGSAEVAFRDGGEFCIHVLNDTQNVTNCYPLTNRIITGQAELSPELVNSFVFVNGLINIVADVTVFRRGDSNGDLEVDISDAQTTLGHLFLGSPRPRCLDAADANDDGKLDISDPIETLQFLFTGGKPLPAPSGAPGEDPTPDGITCGSIE